MAKKDIPTGKVPVRTGDKIILMDAIPAAEAVQRERNRREPWKNDPSLLPGLDRVRRESNRFTV